PSERREVVIDQFPAPLAVALPTWTASAKSFTRALGSEVPEKVGVVAEVMLSVVFAPVSVIRSGTEGAAGGVVSTVTLNAVEKGPTLPAASVARAVMSWTPAVIGIAAP